MENQIDEKANRYGRTFWIMIIAMFFIWLFATFIHNEEPERKRTSTENMQIILDMEKAERNSKFWQFVKKAEGR